MSGKNTKSKHKTQYQSETGEEPFSNGYPQIDTDCFKKTTLQFDWVMGELEGTT